MEEQAKQREGVLLVSSDLSAVEAAENVSGEETANVDILAVQPSSKKASRSSRRSQRSATYRVKSGDNLSAIAKRHGTTVDRLCRLNGISKRTILRPGQVLKCS
jgi:LysM repeat protein